MAGDVFGFHVPRVCRIRGENVKTDEIAHLSGEGLRPDYEDLITDGVNLRDGALAPPAVVAAAGAMVVLGEPGAGKTSVLEDLTSDLPRVGDAWGRDADACLWISGADLTEGSYQDELGRHIDALPQNGADTGSSGVLTVVLDQADESPYLGRLPRRLRKALDNRDLSRVRFLMACRSADYPATMTPVLAGAFRACRQVDLAPLSRKEAVELANSADVHGEELVAAAEQAGAAALAGVPLTLGLLVLIYRADGQLVGSPEDLFARSVAHLAEEPDPGRLSLATETTAPQRLRVAGRIAAWMLLSGRRTVWRGKALEAGAFDLPGGLLAGGFERAPAGSYEVRPSIVKETLATALFSLPDDNRATFRHSSVAAYLAAKYLTDRGTTQQQLANLFLVRSPTGDTTSVPPPLRETAAWLVALNSTATAWLADADPESLAVHSALVRSDEVRQLTVARLLERALEVELSDTRWQLSRWDLFHPLLADQLADVLAAAPSSESAEWRTRARVRLAVQLAQEAGGAHPRLADELLKVAEQDAWHQTERRLAARAAFACDAERAVPVLTRILTSLSEPTYAASIDPDHDLRGTILLLLWPDHLDVTAMLAALRPPPKRNYNAYTEFLRTMAGKSTDEHMPSFLDWTRTAVVDQDPSGAGFGFEAHSTETDWVNSLIDRALRSRHPEAHLGTLAKILLGLCRRNYELRLPECLQPAAQGPELSATRSLRRYLAGALVEEAAASGMEPREASQVIAYDWKYQRPFRLDTRNQPDVPVRHQLLDAEDFKWAREQTTHAASTGSDKLVAVYGELAACLFPRDDHVAFESAYDQDHPAWRYLRAFYDPIELGSPLAEALRRNHEATKKPEWPQAAVFADNQRKLLTQAKDGDNSSLWLFLWNLRADPHTGRFTHLESDDIRQWPGATAYSDDLADLTDLALSYLTTENDHADTWLGQSKHDKRSWAGYLLLTEVHRAERLDELTGPVWTSWTAAILSEMPLGASSFTESVRRDLLHRAATHAPGSLALRATQLASAAVTVGRQPIELNPIDPLWDPELRTAMEDLAVRLSSLLEVPLAAGDNSVPDRAYESDALTLPDSDEGRQVALRTWYSLLGSLLRTQSPTANAIIDAALDGNPRTQLATQAALYAARLLLATDAQKYWPRVKEFAEGDDELGRRLAALCTHDETHHKINRALTEAGLVDLYLWLSGIHVPEADAPFQSEGWVSTEQEVQDWRDGLLRELAQRATTEAVQLLRRLADRYPDRLSVTVALIAATKQHAAANWNQVNLEDVVQVLQSPTRRVIRSSADLLDVVYEILEQVEKELPSHCELLWDRKPGARAKKKTSSTAAVPAVPDTWRPKPEAALCAYIAHELIHRLAGHKVSVNREVLVRPTDPYGAGDRTDILIEAQISPTDTPDTTTPVSIKLVVELKGSWNPGITTSQETQLADRYLPEVETDVGIYLIGWYPIELWDVTRDGRRTQAKKLTHDKLMADLEEQASILSKARTIQLRPLVINVPRPHKQ
ncbi:hypothetical protein J8N05_14070 [Streptomyces sp. BH-SS-21]|uniref:Uncharacterized protein n=1 Tax=Streptomyces liliiviolaceus TaxID=2823109 RepID=A0A940XSE8_9ACTN|nr:hypothetical protein [Streptomyces liliiviolaceus]MBQ0849331.1 hypothetical protein [Streptomyces liliiviolaceus]